MICPTLSRLRQGRRTLWLWGLFVLTVLAPNGLSDTRLGAAPSVFFVSPQGNDNGPGTSGQPFRTLAKGVSVLNPGDTLVVAPGTYTETLIGNIRSGSSWSAPITIRAADLSNRPVMRPNGGAFVVQFATYQGQPIHHVIFDGFVLDGSSVEFETVKITTGANNIRLQNTEIRNSPRNGVLMTDAADYNELRNLEVHHNGQPGNGHGIYMSTSNNLLEGSTIYSNAQYGVHVYSGSNTHCDNNTVRGNRVYGHQAEAGIGLFSGQGHLAMNNLVYSNNGGIHINYGARAAQVLHNTVVGNSGFFAVAVGPESEGAMVHNNVLWQNSDNRVANVGSGTTAHGNLVSGNPLFVNQAAGDFRVNVGSPAIDAGISLSGVTADFTGVTRPQGAGFDAGAHEFHYIGPPQTPRNLRITPRD